MKKILALGLLVTFLGACSGTPDPTPNIDEIVAATIAAHDLVFYQTRLVAPEDGAIFDHPAQVTLSWEWVRFLEEGEVFDVRVWKEGQPDYGITWHTETSFDLAQWLSQQEPGEFLWTIAALKVSGDTIDEIIGFPAEPRRLSVRTAAIPTPTLTPTPQAISVDDIVGVPRGFQAHIYAYLWDLSTAITSFVFAPNGDMILLAQAGPIVRLRDADGDGIAEERVNLLNRDDEDLVRLNWAMGIALYEDRIYVSDSGRIGYFLDTDGDDKLDEYHPIIEDLPSLEHTFHSNNGIAFDADGNLYVGVGSVSDHGPLRKDYEASVLRMDADGNNVEVFATGFRNPFGMTISPSGEIFVSDNGPDRFDDLLQFTPPEELNHVRQGYDYGFPDVFGAGIQIRPPERDVESPVAQFVPSSVPTGLAYYGADRFPDAFHDGIFLALYGDYQVVFVRLAETDDGTFRGIWTNFARFRNGHRAVPIQVGPDGMLYMVDWHAGYVLRVDYVGG